MGRVSNSLRGAGFDFHQSSPQIAGLLVTGEVISNIGYEDGRRNKFRYTLERFQQRARDAYPHDHQLADILGDFFYESYLMGYEEGSRT